MIKLKFTDLRWKGREEELQHLVDNYTSDARALFGTYNNALFLFMGVALDKVKALDCYSHEIKRQVKGIWNEYRIYEGGLKAGEGIVITVESLSEYARKFYKDDLTDAEFFEYWCANGARGYDILNTWVTVLANKYKVFLTSRNIKYPEAVSWLMATFDLFNMQDTLWLKIVDGIMIPNGLKKDGVYRMFNPFRMRSITLKWQRLLHTLCPDLRHIYPDEVERRNFDITKGQMFQNIDTLEFYFGGARDAAEDYQELFRTKGLQKKALKQMAEARANWNHTDVWRRFS